MAFQKVAPNGRLDLDPDIGLSYDELQRKKLIDIGEVFQDTLKFAMERTLAHLKKELPGHDESYYQDTLERILITSQQQGYSISSTLSAFIIGAKNRNE